jgi:hypothetical protein
MDAAFDFWDFDPWLACFGLFVCGAQNIMNEKFAVLGASWGPHSKYRFCCVLDFAGGFGPKTNRLSQVFVTACTL